MIRSIASIGSQAPCWRLLSRAKVTSVRGQCESTPLTPTLMPSFHQVTTSPPGSTSNSKPKPVRCMPPGVAL